MRIAINTRFLLSSKMEGFGWYTYEIAKRLVENHPEHDFIFLFDRPFDEKFVFAKNVEPVVINPPARHPFLFYLWFEFGVKKALKKHKADLFFSPDGYLSLSSNIPQIAVMHDLNFEHNPQDLKWLMRSYYRRFFPKFAEKASKIITVSDYSKEDIIKTYDIDPLKISSIWNGASDVFKPISADEKKSIQNEYANGQPFFLFVGALHPRKNVKRLILAFEQMKIANPDNKTQLIIVGTELWSNSKTNIKVKEEIQQQIIFTGHLSLDKLSLLMASALALTYIPYFEGFGIPLVEAMKCGTPILAGDKTSLPEIAGDAAIYCNPFKIDEIANQLQEISTNSSLRQNLSIKGLERSKLFSWDKSAAQVWDEIITLV